MTSETKNGSARKATTTESLFENMLSRIRGGQWPVGSAIPGERTLVNEFGVSRIALREALCMLRSLGLLEVAHGKATTVRSIDANVLGRLFPLLLALEGERTFRQVFQVRLALEVPSTHLAAQRRTEADLVELDRLAAAFKEQSENRDAARVRTDLDFHVRLAQASGNPVFAALLQAISAFVLHVQDVCCHKNFAMQERAWRAHEHIIDAVRHRDAQRAAAEMDVHLRYAADQVLQSGIPVASPAAASNGKAKRELKKGAAGTTQSVFEQMLERIRIGAWPEGSAIPGERTLMTEFGVSRIALREALSMLRSLGLLDVSHGKSSTIRRIDAETLGRLFPLMLTDSGEQTFRHIVEIRLALEVPAAASAARHRTDEDALRLRELRDLYNRQSEGNSPDRKETDLAFHLAIAKASGNPLLPALLSALSSLVMYGQIMSPDDVYRRRRSREAHDSMVESIIAGDSDRARAEMEAHIRYNADRVLRTGVLTATPASAVES